MWQRQSSTSASSQGTKVWRRQSSMPGGMPSSIRSRHKGAATPVVGFGQRVKVGKAVVELVVDAGRHAFGCCVHELLQQAA